MLIKLRFTIILFLLTISLYAQPNDTIYGNVKSIREKVVFLDSTKQQIRFLSLDGDYGHSGFTNPEWITSRFSKQWFNSPWVHYVNYHKEFNEKGKVINETWFYIDNDTVTNYKYQYDARNNLIQTKEKFIDEGYSVRYYSYNSQNKVKTSLNYFTSEPEEYIYRVYDYDALSNLIRVKTFNEDGESSSWIYQYDHKYRKIIDKTHKPYVYVKTKTDRKTVSDSIGSFRNSKKYIYDDNNRIIETQTFDTRLDEIQKLKPQSKVKNIYENDLLKEVQYIRDTIVNTTQYNYDKRKRLIKKSILHTKYSDNNKSLIYSYGANNNIIKLIHTENSITKVVTFNYKFDKHNNWIQQTKSVDGIELYIWTREIKYYN